VPGTLKPDFLQLLRILSQHSVDFILVGGVAAVVQGAPIMTFDLDVLYSTDADNVVRLLAAIDALEGYYRLQPDLVTTRFGPLDLLGSIGNSRGYQHLLPHTISMDAGEGTTVRVLDLETLIDVKEETAGKKDRAAAHPAPYAGRIATKVTISFRRKPVYRGRLETLTWLQLG
jgi:hypothetical protein